MLLLNGNLCKRLINPFKMAIAKLDALHDAYFSLQSLRTIADSSGENFFFERL